VSDESNHVAAAVRNRIKGHRRVRAGDLVPHELNPRRHPDTQRRALLDLYAEVGFARSLLAYELPDGRLKLIDGHLRRDIDPDMIVDVEVLDVDDAEARALLLSIDPLAQLAECDDEVLGQLRDMTATQSDALANLWDAIGRSGGVVEQSIERAREENSAPEVPAEQFLILVTCPDEETQRKLLERFQQEGLECKALVG
jgi:hypothetical protein